MKTEQIENIIKNGNTSLGIELGSTRIKAVLIDNNSHNLIASGNYSWKSKYENKIFTYSIDDVWKGIQQCYKSLKRSVKEKYNIKLEKIGFIGISGMMHGYMAFDKENNILTPFRTWQNTFTEVASKELTEAFNYKIPQRWTIAHLYQAILNAEKHVKNIEHLSTLSVYVHYKLTGNFVTGIGEASGIFPIDVTAKNYNNDMIIKFEDLIRNKSFRWKLRSILPKVLQAGENAGYLTDSGALLLDPEGDLKSGILFCPPEGDAGTGMVATNTISKKTSNISAGTSIFSMVVLDKELSKVYDEIDIVTTPEGNLVAMVHVNNCTIELNSWMKLFQELFETFNIQMDYNVLINQLVMKAMDGDLIDENILLYNYHAGEHITKIRKGYPLFIRDSNSDLSLSNFMKMQLFSAVSVLKIGMDILQKNEKIEIDFILGHGGLFKTKQVGQNTLSSALNVPISIMKTASEGGAWGMAILASYMNHSSISLDNYLMTKVFHDIQLDTVMADSNDIEEFESYHKKYVAGLSLVGLADTLFDE
ncbi:MAG: xylulokinase [Breznakia sp.]